jgi:hypothetical protein
VRLQAFDELRAAFEKGAKSAAASNLRNVISGEDVRTLALEEIKKLISISGRNPIK